MATFDLEFEDWVPRASGQTVESFPSALRLAAAMFWYGRGEISQGTAAAVAGLDRTDFLLTISKHGQSFINLEPEEIAEELARIKAEYMIPADA